MRSRQFMQLVCIFNLSICWFVTGFPVAARTLRVGVYENRPKIYTTADGHVVGIFPDILAAIAAKEEWTLEYRHGAWDVCLERLTDGSIDIMPDVAYSERRARKYAFGSQSVFINWGKVYVPKDKRIESLLELDGKRVAVMRDSIHTDGKDGIKELVREFGIRCQWTEVENYKAVFQLLDANAVDAGVVNRLFGQQHKHHFEVSPTTIIFNPNHIMFAMPKGRPQTPYLIKKLDTHLQRMKADPDSVLHRTIEGYVLGFSPEVVRKRPDGGRMIVLSDTEKRWIRQHPVIRLGIDPEFAPYEFISSEGEYRGIASDYIALLNQRLGLNIRIVKDMEWQATVAAAKAKRIDALTCVGKTEERQKYFRYSNPYIQFERVVLTRTEMPFLTHLAELNDKRIGVQTASSHAGYIADQTTLEADHFPTFQAALKALSRGRIDAVIANLATASYWIRKLHLANLKIAMSLPGERETLHFAIRDDWPELVTILNKGLAGISPSEAAEIRRQWVTPEFDQGLDPHTVALWITAIMAPGLLIVIGMTAWNRRLKHEIMQRKRAENVRDALMHMIVHDLNNPLSGIIASTELMQFQNNKAILPTEKLERHLQQMHASAVQMRDLVQEILDVSRLEQGNMPVSLATVDASELVQELQDQFTDVSTRREKHICIDTMASHPIVMADGDLLRRVLQNLVSNALRHTQKGGKITCYVHNAKTSGLVVIGIQDDGPGIPAELQDRIFDKFFRATRSKNERQYGIGLGLTFCKMAIQAQNGSISVQSTVGTGTVFEIRLPSADSSCAPADQ